MGIRFTNKRISILVSGLFIFFSGLFAQMPQGYYDEAEGKREAQLKTALHYIIKDHIILEYYSMPVYFRETDWHPDEYYWDMYSNNKRSSFSGMNREHCMPKSWWSTNPESTIAYSDLHNLYPSDATANEAKSNYPLGIVRAGAETFDNDLVKIGTSGFSGYSREVFEPADEYKGDFARTYMYMVTCYEDYSDNWRSLGTSSMLQRNTYPTFTPYAINLLLQWHNDDPVSEKEINRNNAVYRIQNNRNPFIDRPAFARLIWAPNTEIEINLAIYPNPTSGYLMVDFGNAEFDRFNYNIYSINGVLMQQEEVSVGNQISVSGLNNGLYILVIYAGNKRVTERFIVNKSLAD